MSRSARTKPRAWMEEGNTNKISACVAVVVVYIINGFVVLPGTGMGWMLFRRSVKIKANIEKVK